MLVTWGLRIEYALEVKDAFAVDKSVSLVEL